MFLAVVIQLSLKKKINLDASQQGQICALQVVTVKVMMAELEELF
jgi:hypothetical protein